MRGRSRSVALAAAALIAMATPSFAKAKPRAADADARIRYVRFDNDVVTTVPVAMGVSTMVQLQSDEVIETISAGETKTWSIVPKKGSGILFVKPTEPGSRTNVNIVTSKRVYALAFVSTPGRAVYQVRFRFPDDDAAKALASHAAESAAHPDLKTLNPAALNYAYAYKGSDQLKPRVAFDNGGKTFLEFAGEVPSIFLVKANGEEAVVNARREGRFMVIDKVAAQFTLRAGELETCLFNTEAATPRPPDEVETIYGPRKAEPAAWFAPGALQGERP